MVTVSRIYCMENLLLQVIIYISQKDLQNELALSNFFLANFLNLKRSLTRRGASRV